MRVRLKQTHVEWGFVVLLAGFCAVLSVLQYHWTGELSRAEAERMRAGINEQAQEFCRAFDSTLTRSCEALVPADENLNDDNREEIHVQQFQKWKSSNPRPIFSQVAVAVSTLFGSQLFGQDLTTGKLTPVAWPSDWNSLQMLFSRRPMGGPPPYENPQGLLFALPVFNARSWSNGPPDRVGGFGGPGSPGERGPPFGRGRPPEMEWVIFELDTNYLRDTWLPELTRRYLNPGAHAFNNVVIKTVSSPRTVIFSSPVQSTNTFESPVTIAFNRQGRSPDARRGPGAEFCWELQVRPHWGAVDAIVDASRRRNLTVALLLNGLIFAAGFALLVHTRRSRKLSQAQMAFVANVSHEIRTPLTVIRGAGHNLLRGVAREPGQIEQYSRLIIQHAEQLTNMVEQVLELAGVRKNASASVHAPVAVADVLREAVAATRQDTETAHCEVHLELTPGLPPVVGDAPALRRVFQNLITNAAKHGGQGGWIGIAATRVESGNPPMIEIKVADRGPGIPMEELTEIFKPFFRGAAAQAGQVRGSGLGLSLVREIVEAHGGTVWAESQFGHGSTFIVRLPASNGIA
ncbi:MAG TPA: HAMP domain-containing sensor histidine kinase [Verrucomicrobiae bacterium]|nr:HAMP domain-containing sensor histidine kinase [Verrucomicrobiae bacterium]